jgi:hypothetical protein
MIYFIKHNVKYRLLQSFSFMCLNKRYLIPFVTPKQHWEAVDMEKP